MTGGSTIRTIGGDRRRAPACHQGRCRPVVVVALAMTLAVPSASWAGAVSADLSARSGPETDGFRPTFDVAPSSPVPAEAPVAAPAAPRVPTLPLPGSWPAIEIRTLLVALHLMGLCFGLGGATMLDFWILRWMRWGYLPDNVVRTFEFLSKAVSAGLVMLWGSGLSFLMMYDLYDPAKLANPKLVAKILIVVALTLNGFVVHRLVLPYVAQSCRMPLFDGFRRRRRMLFILSGSLSGLSWFSAFALGLLHEFNGRVPALTLIGIWLTLVLLSTAVLDALLSLAPPSRPPRAAEGDLAG